MCKTLRIVRVIVDHDLSIIVLMGRFIVDPGTLYVFLPKPVRDLDRLIWRDSMKKLYSELSVYCQRDDGALP